MTDATAPLPDLRDEFATVYLPSRNLADNTRATYLRVVDACLAYLAAQGVTEVEAVGLRKLNGSFARPIGLAAPARRGACTPTPSRPSSASWRNTSTSNTGRRSA